MAARKQFGCLAQPADAAGARARSAGAAHRTERARFRTALQRARSAPKPCREDLWRAVDAVALYPTSWRSLQRALERSTDARRSLSGLGARARPARAHHSGAGASAEAAAGRAADYSLCHRNRGLAARPLYDLRQTRVAAAAA